MRTAFTFHCFPDYSCLLPPGLLQVPPCFLTQGASLHCPSLSRDEAQGGLMATHGQSPLLIILVFQPSCIFLNLNENWGKHD